MQCAAAISVAGMCVRTANSCVLMSVDDRIFSNGAIGPVAAAMHETYFPAISDRQESSFHELYPTGIGKDGFPEIRPVAFQMPVVLSWG